MHTSRKITPARIKTKYHIYKNKSTADTKYEDPPPNKKKKIIKKLQQQK